MRREAGLAAGRTSASSPAVRSRSTSLSSSTGPIHDLRAGRALMACTATAASTYTHSAIFRHAYAQHGICKIALHHNPAL